MNAMKSGNYRRLIEIVVAGGIIVSCLVFWHNLSSVPLNAKAFPLTLTAILGVLAAIIGGRAIFRPDAAGFNDPKKANWTFFVHVPRFVFTIAIFVLYVVALEPVGFFVSSAAFLIALALVLGYRKPKMVVLTYGLFLLFVFSIFVAVFDRPLPKDFWQRSALETQFPFVAQAPANREVAS